MMAQKDQTVEGQVCITSVSLSSLVTRRFLFPEASEQAAGPKQSDSESPDSWTEMPPSLCGLAVVHSEVSSVYVAPAQALGKASCSPGGKQEWSWEQWRGRSGPLQLPGLAHPSGAPWTHKNSPGQMAVERWSHLNNQTDTQLNWIALWTCFWSSHFSSTLSHLQLSPALIMDKGGPRERLKRIRKRKPSFFSETIINTIWGGLKNHAITVSFEYKQNTVKGLGESN